LATWDGAHYLNLAQHWYTQGDSSCAFYPLWPALIHLVAPLLGGNPLFTGLLLANILSAASICFFYTMVAEKHGAKTSQTSVLLMLAFPGALFLCFVYTEPLFFLLAILFFRGLFNRNTWLVVASGFFLPLTRAVGVFILLPLFWDLMENGWRQWKNCKGKASPGQLVEAISNSEVTKPTHFTNGTSPTRNQYVRCLVSFALQPFWLGIVAILSGYSAYFAIMYLATGNPFDGFLAQQYYPNRPSVANMMDVQGFFYSFKNVGEIHGMLDSVIDRLLFAIFLLSLPAIWRLDRRYFWYALGTGLVPAMSNWFLSYTRFFEMCFPAFIVLAGWLDKPETKWLLWYYVGLAGVTQIAFVVRHINFYWAG